MCDMETLDFGMLGLCQTKAELRILNAILKYAKEKNVTIQTAICPSTTEFKTNSASFYSSDRKIMREKFEKIGAEFVEQASKQFIDSRLSDTIKISRLTLSVERGYNIVFNPNNTSDLKPTPYANFVLTIYCCDMEDFGSEKEK